MPAVDRAARLLALLEASGRSMTLSELARGLSINKGTARDLLETLRAHGLLERDAERKQYRLGQALARLGLAALGQHDLASLARPYLTDLAAEINGAVLLVVPRGDRATIVDKVDGERGALEISATVGGRLRLAAGALGKVMLADASEHERRRQLASLTPTPRTITDLREHAAAIETARRLGYATDDQEYLSGVRAVAAPVRGAQRQVAAAVLVVGLLRSLPSEDLQRTGEATARTARAISAALGAPSDNGQG